MLYEVITVGFLLTPLPVAKLFGYGFDTDRAGAVTVRIEPGGGVVQGLNGLEMMEGEIG